MVPGNETNFYENDPESKRQGAERHTPSSLKPKKAGMNKSQVENMLIVFFFTA